MKSTIITLWCVIATCCFTSGGASAQTCDSLSHCTPTCACVDDDLNPSGIMLGHEHAKGAWMLSYRYMRSAMQGNMEEAHTVVEDYIYSLNYVHSPVYMNMDMHMLMAMYGITDKFSVMAMFNYNAMDMGMNMFGGGHNHSSGTSSGHSHSHGPAADMSMHSKGLGDTELYAMYKLLKKNVHSFFLHAGATIPTGSIHVKGEADDAMYPSLRFPYMMQLGSGTIDFMPGATYLMYYKKMLLGAQATSVIRPFQNKNGYTLGNKLNLNFWAAYKWFNWLSNSVRVEDSYASSIQGRDMQVSKITEPGGNPANYGGQNVNVYAGMNIYFNKSFLRNSKLIAEYGIPIYQYANGIQQKQVANLYLSWIFTF